MSDNTQSYLNFHNYEYYIVSKLNFARVGEELVNANVITEEERQKFGSISGSKKQNTSLVGHLYDERRQFGPFLSTLRRDSSCDQHAQLTRTILARCRNKSEDQVDDSDIFPRSWSGSDQAERLRLKREDSSDSDSSAFTYATQDFSDSISFVGSDKERESECEGNEAVRRSVTPRGSSNSPQRIQNVSQDKRIEKKYRLVSMMVLLFWIVFAILTMPLKIGNKVRKFILPAGLNRH